MPMKRTHEPMRLDVAAFAADAGTLEAREPVASFDRLSGLLAADAPAEEVAWTARGELRHPRAVQPQVWLSLSASAGVWMTCQRCLQAVRVPLDLQRHIRFVADEDTAARMDAESDDDVLALERSLDIRTLVEDELLLALPIVPRHEHCPVALPTSAEPDDASGAAAPNPFAALEALKRRQ
jgi:uncharacterized protein